MHLYRSYVKSLYYLKGNKTDVDFYISDTNSAIQVAYSIKDENVKDREINNLIEFAKSTTNIGKLLIVTYEEEAILEQNGYKIEVVPLKKFLLS